MEKVAIAGATGYLGKHIVKEAIAQGFETVALVRNLAKLSEFEGDNLYKIKADVTKPKSLKGKLKGVDTVISTVGITRQKDGLTYMDVDYQANRNLLDEAISSGVRKFIFVSAFKLQELKHLKIAAAKERFVDELKMSGLEYTIMRPTGFFSDMRDFLDMAKRGRVYLFGSGNLKLNPIHGADLAKACLKAIATSEKEINVGGPETFTHNELAALALKTMNKPESIVHLPDWIRRFILWSLRAFTPLRVYGPAEFFLTAMAYNMEAPKYGSHHLKDFYREIANANMGH